MASELIIDQFFLCGIRKVTTTIINQNIPTSNTTTTTTTTTTNPNNNNNSSNDTNNIGSVLNNSSSDSNTIPNNGNTGNATPATSVLNSTENTQTKVHYEPFLKETYPNLDSKRNSHNKIVPSFCFPEDTNDLANASKSATLSRNNEEVYFTFVLTNEIGIKQYGFCRRIPALPARTGTRRGHARSSSVAVDTAAPSNVVIEELFNTPDCICILSHHPWFTFHYRLLEIIEERYLVSMASVIEFVSTVMTQPFPIPGESFTLILPQSSSSSRASKLLPSEYEFTRPTEKAVATDLNFKTLFDNLSINNVLSLFNLILQEQHIILSSKHLTKMSHCAHTCLKMLASPISWQSICIPVMPCKKDLLEYTMAPVPFFFGVHSSAIQQIKKLPTEQVVFVDLDSNTIALPRDMTTNGGPEMDPTGQQSIPPLPDPHSRLKTTLEKLLMDAKKTEQLDNGGVMEAFRQWFNTVFGSYRNYIHPVTTDNPITTNITTNNINGAQGPPQPTIVTPTVQPTDLKQAAYKFDKDEFIRMQNKSSRKFLEVFCTSQMFERFIAQCEENYDSLSRNLFDTSNIEKDTQQPKLHLSSVSYVGQTEPSVTNQSPKKPTTASPGWKDSWMSSDRAQALTGKAQILSGKAHVLSGKAKHQYGEFLKKYMSPHSASRESILFEDTPEQKVGSDQPPLPLPPPPGSPVIPASNPKSQLIDFEDTTGFPQGRNRSYSSPMNINEASIDFGAFDDFQSASTASTDSFFSFSPPNHSLPKSSSATNLYETALTPSQPAPTPKTVEVFDPFGILNGGPSITIPATPMSPQSRTTLYKSSSDAYSFSSSSASFNLVKSMPTSSVNISSGSASPQIPTTSFPSYPTYPNQSPSSTYISPHYQPQTPLSKSSTMPSPYKSPSTTQPMTPTTPTTTNITSAKKPVDPFSSLALHALFTTPTKKSATPAKNP